jgi:hypothetical protein
MVNKSVNGAAAKYPTFRVTEWEDWVGQAYISAGAVVYIVTHKIKWNVLIKNIYEKKESATARLQEQQANNFDLRHSRLYMQQGEPTGKQSR